MGWVGVGDSCGQALALRAAKSSFWLIHQE